MTRAGFWILICCLSAACRGGAPPPAPPSVSARSLLIVTIDTLRADRVGVYGYGAARTPALDSLARDGVRFTHAFAAAPITLTSHASLMTGRYPAGHGARHNGMRLDPATPTLADALGREGFVTAAFVGAFPLDRRFGLIKGFQTYGDQMPRGGDGRLLNERSGRAVVDEALAWLDRHRHERFFLWVHLFEPHAPYGDPSDPAQRRRPAGARYDDEVAEADTQVARLMSGLADARASTLIVAAADHGEAFGEHGEIGHSIFLYDTTLRVPLVAAGPGIPAARTIVGFVSLVDVAPTLAHMLGVRAFDADGVDLGTALAGADVPSREIYAESFAPLLDFGWSPLRSVRASGLKYIEAPAAELYDTTADPGETTNVIDSNRPRAAALEARVRSYSSSEMTASANADPETLARLQALGYVSGSARTDRTGRTDRTDRTERTDRTDRTDPKSHRELAARIAQVTSGELEGDALESALRGILAEDPHNPQAHLRLGYALVERGRCTDATAHFTAAIAARMPTADAHLGLAGCQTAARRFDAAAATLKQANTVEPDNPVVLANLGLVLSDGGHPADAVAPLQRALAIDPDLHQARFGLALAFARAERRDEAAATAEDLLRRLPANALQRPEVERLLRTLRPAPR